MRSAQLIRQYNQTTGDESGPQRNPVILAKQQKLLRSAREGKRLRAALLVDIGSDRRVVCTQTDRHTLQTRQQRVDGVRDRHQLEIVDVEKMTLG
jgi:hypothetical protein